MTALAKAKPKVPYFDTTITTDVDVEIDPDDLHDAGWHHENECDKKTSLLGRDERQVYRDAIASLHRQAHPSQPLDPFVPLLCRKEPCRSLGVGTAL